MLETSVSRAPDKAAPNLGDLVEDALNQAKSLVQAEFSLARRELLSELKTAAGSLLGALVGLLFLQAALATLGVLLVLALGVKLGIAVVVGFLAIGAAGLLSARRSLRMRLLPRTTARLALDAKQVMETVK
jgi:hypothetical protein